MLQNIDERRDRIRRHREDAALALCTARAWRDIATHVADTYVGGNEPARDAKVFAVRLLQNTAKKYEAEADVLEHRAVTLERMLGDT